MLPFPKLPKPTTMPLLALAAAAMLISATPLIAQGGAGGQAASGAAPGDSAAIVAAQAAAAEWLEVLDSGDYEETWHTAASAFQDALTPASWAAAVSQAREPFEPFGERTLVSSGYETELPGAPPGEYVILQYRTEVQGDRKVVETIVPMKDGDAWKVSGYFVRAQ